DVRHAPALALIDELLAEGAVVAAHDPVAMDNVRREFGDKVQFVNNPYLAVQGADGLFLVTEWNEFRQPDFARIKAAMRQPVLFVELDEPGAPFHAADEFAGESGIDQLVSRSLDDERGATGEGKALMSAGILEKGPGELLLPPAGVVIERIPSAAPPLRVLLRAHARRPARRQIERRGEQHERSGALGTHGRPGGRRESAEGGSEDDRRLILACESVDPREHPRDGEVEERRLVEIRDRELDAAFVQAIPGETPRAGAR